MTTQIKSPAGWPGVKVACGGDPNPQQNHEAELFDCQDKSGQVEEPVELLKEHYFRHAEIMSQRWREIVQIEYLLGYFARKQAQLEAQLVDARSEYEAESEEMARLQRRAFGREVRS
jgi:hypothetical protein